jgi:stage V sporulation protein G
MEITEVRVKLLQSRNDKLQAFCSVTIDNEFVIRDLKIIEGSKGPFVAMPSRKLTDKCGRCGGKNHLRAKFCNECGQKLPPNRVPTDPQGRAKLHTDIAHPINSGCRKFMQERILDSYQEQLNLSQMPGYQPPVFDDFPELEEVDVQAETATPKTSGEENPDEFGAGIFD